MLTLLPFAPSYFLEDFDNSFHDSDDYWPFVSHRSGVHQLGRRWNHSLFPLVTTATFRYKTKEDEVMQNSDSTTSEKSLEVNTEEKKESNADEKKDVVPTETNQILPVQVNKEIRRPVQLHLTVSSDNTGQIISTPIPTGVNKDQLTVSIDGQLLTVKAKIESEGKNYRVFNRFTQSIRLDENTDADKIVAQFNDGELKILAPYKSQNSSKNIPID